MRMVMMIVMMMVLVSVATNLALGRDSARYRESAM